MNLASFSFRKNIFLILALPVVACLWGAINVIVESNKSSNKLSDIQAQVKLSTVYSNLVHELQKERGMTAGFLGSNGVLFKTELREQRKRVNEQLAYKDNYLSKNSFDQATLKAINKKISDLFSKLSTLR